MKVHTKIGSMLSLAVLFTLSGCGESDSSSETPRVNMAISRKFTTAVRKLP